MIPLFFDPSWWMVPVMVFLITQVSAFGTSVYLHRGLNHGSLQFSRSIEFVWRMVLWITTTQKREQWVAVHRKHHTFTDKEGDPHSPRLMGFWRVQFLNALYYSREASDPETVRRFAPDIREDWLERHVFSHTFVGPVLGLAGLFVLFGWKGVLIGLLHGMTYVFVLAPLINALGHWRGQQNYSDNTAFNWKWLSWLTAGEALHNNHHKHPAAPKFSMRVGEFDPSWPLIRALVAMRLAKLVHAPVHLESAL
jgi:stearoyl-CoA desaturase (Delta-9 desaturase)